MADKRARIHANPQRLGLGGFEIFRQTHLHSGTARFLAWVA
jgi:hypothetical protein